ncbi:MAG: V-type ATP synthase subunit D [Candidatus Aenigmarchaeota archaeon]|nr:V-type ATP synthase subunit D [Candidatus Aenigmarchaeota archaeon]
MAAMNVKPTRSELIKLRKSIKLAESGYKLLKKKRDGLILEFFNALKDAKDVRKELNEKYNIAYKKLQHSIALDGIVEIKTLSMALKERPSVELEVRNVMGVSIPVIKHGTIRKSLMERGYGLFSSSIRMEETAKSYEELLELIVKTAETETKLRNILIEIEKTKRRVNSLEYIVIPRLKEAAAFIAFRLEELDRENIFRLKKIKQKITV